jgi:hypothetical protein
MAITLTDNARNAAANGIVDLIDVGGTGTLEIKSAASTVSGTSEVATLTFQATAFGAAASGTATVTPTMVSDTNAAGGTAGFYTVFDGASAAVWQGLVATSASDLNLSSITIGAGDTVSISAFTLTVPAS